MRRLGAAALLAASVVALSGQASAVNHLPTLSINDVPVAEGGLATFTVTLSAPAPPGGVTVTATTVDDSAVAPGDYAANAGSTVMIAEGATTAPFTVQTAQDPTDEIDETFFVDLSSPSPNAEIAPTGGRGGGRIIDDDTAVATITGELNPSVAEGSPARFNVSLSTPSSRNVKVDWATENGGANPATPGSDYTQVAPGSTTFPAGQTGPREITVTTVDDALDEEDETFVVRLTGADSGATVGSPSAGNVTIKDLNDDPPTVSINDVSLNEGNSGTVDFNFEVKLSAASGKTIKVSFATAPGTATNDVDFTPTIGEITFLPGILARTVTVPVKGDVLSEPDETFVVNLSNLVNVAVGDLQGLGTIKNDDAAPVPTFEPFTQPLEGNSGTTALTLTLKRAPSGQAATFDFRLVAGSATVGVDYQVPGQTTVTFPASPADPVTRPIAIPIVGDTLDENDETFTVEVVRPADGVVVASAPVTIVNDDNNSKLAISDGSVDEPSTDSATLKLNVTLSPASARAVSVGWATADGTATAGSDYTAATGTLDFAPGETSKEITVTVAGDTVNEDNETVLVNLSGATGVPPANVIGAQGVGTIIDKNAPPSLSIDDILTREGETATFTITLSGNTLRTVTVVAKTIEGTAKEGTEYHARRTVFTFAPGEKSKTFQVPGIDDTISEGIELYYVGLEDAVNATITKNRGTATIDVSDQVAVVPAQKLPPAGKPPTTKPPAVKPTLLLPRMVLGPRVVTVNAGLARMLVTCAKNSPLACAGSISFERVAKPKLVFGTKAFTVKPGKKGYVAVELTAPALKLLAQKKTLPARAVVIVKTSAKNLTVAPGVITLKQGTKPARLVLVNAGIAQILVTCAKNSPLACAGSVSFERVAKPKLVFGTKAFTVKPGTKLYVAVKLTAPALKLLAQKKTMPARAVVIVKTSAKYLTFAPGVVTLIQVKTEAGPTKVVVDP